MGISNEFVGFVTDPLEFSPHKVALFVKCLTMVPGVIWIVFSIFFRNRLKEGECVGAHTFLT